MKETRRETLKILGAISTTCAFQFRLMNFTANMSTEKPPGMQSERRSRPQALTNRPSSAPRNGSGLGGWPI